MSRLILYIKMTMRGHLSIFFIHFALTKRLILHLWTLTIAQNEMSHDMRFPTMWHFDK